MKNASELKSQNTFSFLDLVDIMKLLRAPGGCPWDREQTHASIRENMLEEAYEVAEAIDLNDPDLLCEELGDVLLQVVFHAEMSEEEQSFSMDSVIDGVCKKLIERHPHIFSDLHVNDSGEVLNNWDAIKQKSKNRKNVYEELDGICRALPALMRAEKIARKLRKRSISVPCDIAEKKLSELAPEEIGKALFYLTAFSERSESSAEEQLQRYNETVISSQKDNIPEENVEKS